MRSSAGYGRRIIVVIEGWPCAGGGHFVTCIPLRLALSPVAKEEDADHREDHAKL